MHFPWFSGRGADMLVHPGVETIERRADAAQFFGVTGPEEHLVTGTLESNGGRGAHLADAADGDGFDREHGVLWSSAWRLVFGVWSPYVLVPTLRVGTGFVPL